MASPEHLERLHRGVDAWNAWRASYPDAQPDLEKANLAGVDLRWADLRAANLRAARFRNARLDDVNLSSSSLRRADLTNASLIDANITGANLGSAILRSATLTRAYLDGANLAGAILDGADLCQARVRWATLNLTQLAGANLAGAVLRHTAIINCDLSETRGLDACEHRGPSGIDVQTLIRSGDLPLVFLQGCGLSDSVINVLDRLSHESDGFHSCFISYSSRDDKFAQRLHDDLQLHGVRCWFAPEDMKIGDTIRTRIDEAIRRHDKLLLVLSEHSVASDWVTSEVETAFEKEREQREPALFPIRLDDAVILSRTGWAADIRRTRHIGNFTRWDETDQYQQSLARLLRDLTSRDKVRSGEELR